jgi:acyl-coenzyme A synthetase/AMP-(fatty) acid ligase
MVFVTSSAKETPTASLSTRDSSPCFLTASLAREAERHPERCQYRNGQPITNEELWQEILKAATWLQRNGIERGSVVILALSEDHPLTETIVMAATHVGGVVSVLPKDISKKRFTAIISNCDPACVFLDDGTATFRPSIEGTLTVWMTSGMSSGAWDEAEITEILETKAAWGLPFPGQSDDPAFLVFDETEDVQGKTLSHNRIHKLMTGRNDRQTLNEFWSLTE